MKDALLLGYNLQHTEPMYSTGSMYHTACV